MGKPANEASATIAVTMPCAFCSGEVSFGFTVTDDEPIAFHTMPPCEKFEATGLIEFVTANRRALGLPEPTDEDGEDN